MVIFGLQPQGWGKGMSLLEGLASASRRLIGVQAISSLVSLVEHTTEAATHLVSLSTAMGMTVQQTQEWGYVAEQSGSNLKELSVGLNMYLRNLKEFAAGRGGKALASNMAAIGINAAAAKKIVSGGSDGLNAHLLETADRLKKIGYESKPALATMTRMFGVRAGRAMLADMARGSDAIKVLMERRRAMGELDEKQAFSLRDLGNNIKNVKTSLGAIASLTIADLAPAFNRMLENASKWIAENREMLTTVLGGALKTLAAGFEAVGAVISWLTKLIRKAFGGDTGAQAILIGIAAVIASAVVPSIIAMGVAIMEAVLPLILTVGWYALIAYGILMLVKHWDKVKVAASAVWTEIKKGGNALLDWIASVPGKIEDAFSGAAETIGSAIANLPIIKQLIELYNWAARDGGGTELFNQAQGMVEAHKSAGANAQLPDDRVSARAAANGAGGGNTTINNNIHAPATVSITAKDGKDAKKQFDENEQDRVMRHAMALTGTTPR